jgi:hypothetical protein
VKRALIYAFMLGKGLGWLFLAGAIFTSTVWEFVNQSIA